MKNHWLAAVCVATGAGLAAGVAADFAIGGVDLSSASVVTAVALAPVLVVVGGGLVDSHFATVFLIVGMLFWPVWAFLALRWFKTRRAEFIAVIAVWSALGCFQLLHRLEGVTSA